MSAKTGGIASGATFRRWRASTFLQVGETLHENFSGVTWGFVSACPPVRPHGMSAAFRQDSLVDLGHAVDPAPGAAIFMRPPADTFVLPLICKRCRVLLIRFEAQPGTRVRLPTGMSVRRTGLFPKGVSGFSHLMSVKSRPSLIRNARRPGPYERAVSCSWSEGATLPVTGFLSHRESDRRC